MSVWDEVESLRARLAAVEKERDDWKAAYEAEDRRHMRALARENEREAARLAESRCLLARAGLTKEGSDGLSSG